MRLVANLHTLIWGTESWDVSVYRDSSSVIADGPCKGMKLSDVMPGFPLLVKIIDVRRRNSVQVHPNERTAMLTGGEPKTEMWCVLEPGPIYAGLKPGVTADDVRSAVLSGRFEELLVRHDAKMFDTFLIPGGLVHAFGDGVKVYEVQQNSDTTFRLYDWGRVGADGKPRELHIDKSMQTIDFSLPVPVPQRDVHCDYFDFSQHEYDASTEISAPEGSCLVVYEVASGASTLLTPGERVTVDPGRVFLTAIP